MVEQKMGNKTLRLIRGDITDLAVEAFVFDVTEDLKLGSGFGSAIQQRGGISIQKELDELGTCPVGEAVITSAGKLKAQYIIHTNGPKFREQDEAGKLRRATQAALARAEEKQIKQLALPPIGTGLYQVPMDLSVETMVGVVTEHLRGDTSLEEVIFVANDTREYDPLKKKIQDGV
jgi:O-acetyl-ADP-ribose deacetylase (regulator of RNase III)